jgi:hypothetical protein
MRGTRAKIKRRELWLRRKQEEQAGLNRAAADCALR